MPHVTTPAGKADGRFRGPASRNVLSALAVAVFGFLLLNVASALAALVGLALERTPLGPSGPLALATFLALVAVASWLVLRSRLGTLYKAIFLTVPLASLFATIGILLHPWPALTFLVGGLAFVALLAWLLWTRQPWLYAYTLVLVAATLTAFTLLGGAL